MCVCVFLLLWMNWIGKTLKTCTTHTHTHTGTLKHRHDIYAICCLLGNAVRYIYAPSTRLPHNRIFCGFKSKWAIDFLWRNCNARNTSCMHTVVWCSLNEPASSSNVCSSPPVASSKTRAVSTFVSCTECNLTICGESAHNNSIAISCRISFNVHCARRLRLKNLAAQLTPVCLCFARRTVANLPLYSSRIKKKKKKKHMKREGKKKRKVATHIE